MKTKASKSKLLRMLVTVCATVSFISLTRAEGEEAELLGLRHRNETANGPLTMVSMAGGLEFFIDGEGFDDQPHISSVMFEPTQTDPNLFAGPPLNIDDEIQSATTLGRLAYTMPAITDVLGGVPMETFSTHYYANKVEELEFLVHVDNTADATTSSCPEEWEHKCHVRFSQRYTPLLHDISPSNVYLDQQLSILVNPMLANNENTILDTYDPVVHIKFSGTRCDSEGFIDYETRLSDYKVGSLKTRAGDQHPGNQVPEVRFRVGNALLRESAKHCNFAGDDCWYVKTHPKIDSVSAVDGYITGGQALTINGWGLKGATLDDVVVTVDGVPCQVTSSTQEEIQCVTGAADAISNDGVSQPGSPGLTQQVLNSDDDAANPYWNMQFDGAVPVVETKLLTAFENSYNNYTRAGTLSKGWFKAPATGNYKFYISCDDACRLYLDATNKFDKSAPTEPTRERIAIRHWATGWRNYLIVPDPDESNQYQSDWIPMEEGEFYSIEGFMLQYGSNDHFTVSVEFEQADTAGHHHANKEVQILSIDPENTEEKYRITILNPNGSNYKVTYVNPLYDPNNRRSFQTWTSDAFSDQADIWTVRRRLVGYYWSVWGSNLSVEKTDYDADDIETTDSEAIVKTIYTITVQRMINGPSFTMASIVPSAGATSTITIEAPFQDSTPPLSGAFNIVCPNQDGNEFSTRDIGYAHWAEGIDFLTSLEIPHLQFKAYIRDTGKYSYAQNGREIMIIMQDYHGEVPQCEIRSSESNPISGNNVVFNWSKLREYGQNLMFEPIPLEFLYSDAQQPQVMVTVNGIDGVCPEFNCDYIYIDTEKLIQSQTLTNGVDLTITGVGLPTEDIRVRFANAECTGDIVASETEITCTLNFLPAAGSWDVKLTDYRGLIPIDAAVEQISVGLVIDSVTPDFDLNQLGGDILVFSGTGFDTLDISQTTVVFQDSTICIVQDATPTTLNCLVDGFDASVLDPTVPYTATVTVNGVVNEDMSLWILTTKQSGQTVSPNSVNPVVASVLTVNLESTYPVTLNSADEFTATLLSQDDPDFERKLYVMSVNDADKSLQIKFPGADSGTYNIFLVGEGVGRIDPVPLELTVGSQVTGISPVSGSYLGGTLVTIDGINFSDDKYDNPVKVGSHWCYVQTTNTEQITCRVGETWETEISTVQVLTFLGTSEEAENLIDNTFEFSEPIAAITAMTNAFDPNTNTHVITVEGTGLGTDTAGVEFLIDSVAQTVSSAADTTMTVTITNMLDETSADVWIYFPDGLAAGYLDFTSVTVVPTLVSISPSSGSAGGTLITVTGTGFGVNTQGVNLTHGPSGTDICEEVNMLGYGSFSCLTTAMEITSGDALTLKTASGSYSCGNTATPDDCNYEQLNASSPAVTAASVSSSSTLSIEGSGFPTSNYDVIIVYKGVESSSAVIESDTAITATFDNGVPVSDTESAPSVRFVPSSSRRRLMSLSDADLQLIALPQDITVTNVLSVTDSSSGLSCSFQGGCSYTVTAAGLTASLTDSEINQIDVCGNPCVVDASLSDADQTTCTLPLVSTAYSAQEYDIVTQGTLHDGTWTGTASNEELAKLIDNNNMNDMVDSTASNCYFQIQYKENHVGVLDEVKFFLNKLIDKSPFVDNLIFQGSDDGVTFVDLWYIDKSVHEGWNSHDFEENQPSYNIYRFQGATAGSCRIGEVKLHGIESIDDDNTSYSCTPKLKIDDSVTELNPVIFDAAFTPVLTGMSTRFGSVLGNEQVEFYGTGFSSSATTTVMIDNRECVIDSTTEDTITCTTSDKPYVPDTPKLEIHIDGFGLVATKGKVFRYISRWSDSQTWGYDLAPQDGEAVNIPKGLHLLFDIDVGPKLSFLNVEGSLIFPPDADPEHHRTFDAHYILVQGGYLEVGTEENRYTSKITITMHSTKYDPNLPIFGNKVIGVHYGQLEMHGVERPITWSDLKQTAEIGATEITLNDMNGETLDWQVGEEIVIASTNFSGRDAEQRTITSITNIDTNPVITFDEPLIFKHYAGVQYFGDDFIEMRAEVGLLTRNVKYQGDETSPENQYGAVIIMHSPGDETTAARIDSVELTNVGQAFILGSYPIHFHMIGTVHSSYVRNNAIHHTFNRAVTIHGVHYLRVQNNVAYHTMGHTIFIEDAAETKNLIEHNLIVDVRRSWSLLNTDQTPASIWITNPNNIIRYNHAAGSDRYSYWYDLQITAIGPSFDPNICPENTRLGEFHDNVAHSNGRYGLRIFHNLIPREHPCDPVDYETNKPITANFYNLVSYKNKRNGAIIELSGAVQWHNFKVADNLQVGMEYSRITKDTNDGLATIVGGLIVGRSENTEEALDRASPKGIVSARTENFSFSGVKFYNFNYNHAAAMGTCSHCWHDNNTDSGGRTVTISDLYFDETVWQRVLWTTPWRTIFHDLDGTLTEKGANSWFLPYWKHLMQPNCEYMEAWGGIACDGTKEVRRIAFHKLPINFFGMQMKIVQLDRATESSMGTEELQTYLDSNENYSIVPFKDKQDPMSGWAMPFVTGHRYRIHWAAGLDFDNMYVEVSEKWQPDDQPISLVFNFTETREAVNITTEYGSGEQIMDKTLIEKSTGDLVTGDNWVRNETDIRTFEFIVNGKEESSKKLKVEPLICIHGTCVLEEVEEVELEEGQRLWSDPASWGEGGKVPEEGDEVEIMSGWNMLLDVQETPKLKTLTINGRLSFIQKEDFDIHLMVEKIFVRAGEFIIGTPEEPFTSQATITLLGKQDSETLTLSGTIAGGNKVLGVTNLASFHGKPRDRMSRLLKSSYMGQDTIVVEPELDWQEGDQIYIAPTAAQYQHSEYRTIVSYAGGLITLDEPLDYYHYGEGASTEDKYGVDMRGEVFLLTRNIKIQGEDVDGWGGQILATDIFEMDGTWRKGSLIFDHVQVYNCSQKDAAQSAIRFEGAMGGYSRISNSAVHQGLDWGLMIWDSNNIEIIDSMFVGWRAFGWNLDKWRNCTITGSFVGDVMGRGIEFIDMTIDKEACVAYSSYRSPESGTPSYDITFMNNVAAGCIWAGYVAPGHECGDTEQVSFRNNIAHSIGGWRTGYGVYIYANPAHSTSKCFEMSHFTAYKTAGSCATSFVDTFDHRAHHLTCIDAEMGISFNTGDMERDEVEMSLSDSHIWGETNAEDCPQGGDCYCVKKTAFVNFQNMNDGKPLHPTMASSLPIFVSHGEGNWGGKVTIKNTIFQDFTGLQRCGERSVIFGSNPESSDKIPPHFFENCKFIDVDDLGMAFLEKPPEKWANVKDCGNFPCTAPNNYILSFTGTTYSGITPSANVKDFVIVPDDPTVGGTYPNCQHYPDQQSYICQTRDVGFFQIENLDEDAWDRAVQPIFVLNEEMGFNNTVNAMMDHIWDTFYTGQQRMARFPIQLLMNKDYELHFSGTPPKKMRANIASNGGGVLIKIPYPVAGSIQITANGKKIGYTPWDEELGRHAPLSKAKGCGENRFVGIENYLEFYITNNCLIEIEPKDAIMTKVRMDWSLSEFYSNGGTTRFVDRLAASLGIAANRIKTVAIYEGSVIVDFVIEAEEGKTAEESAKDLEAVQQNLVTQAEEGSLDIGAPIMGIQGSSGEVLAGDPIPDAPGANNNANFFSGEGNSAVIGDGANLWDPLIVEPETIYVQEESEETTAEPEQTYDEVQSENAVQISPESNQNDSQDNTSSNTDGSTTKSLTNLALPTEEGDSSDKDGKIIVTKTVEVIEYEQVADTDNSSTDSDLDKSGKNNNMMVIVVASIVGVLFVVIVAMVVRIIINKKKVSQIPQTVIGEVKTGVVEVEPQFVLAADDSKNIFGGSPTRPSTAPLKDAIERSENKKPGSRDKKRMKKKVTKKATKEERKEGEDSGDDGFQNYEQQSAHGSVTNDSASKVFDRSSRSSRLYSHHDSVSTTRKLNNIALHKVESEDEEQQ